MAIKEELYTTCKPRVHYWRLKSSKVSYFPNIKLIAFPHEVTIFKKPHENSFMSWYTVSHSYISVSTFHCTRFPNVSAGCEMFPPVLASVALLSL